ncbi:MAG: hypothetical protein H0U75_05120 [Legionella sp.]|nr:hypothetical protein [Legionella sp.]
MLELGDMTSQNQVLLNLLKVQCDLFKKSFNPDLIKVADATCEALIKSSNGDERTIFENILLDCLSEMSCAGTGYQNINRIHPLIALILKYQVPLKAGMVYWLSPHFDLTPVLTSETFSIYLFQHLSTLNRTYPPPALNTRTITSLMQLFREYEVAIDTYPLPSVNMIWISISQTMKAIPYPWF